MVKTTYVRPKWWLPSLVAVGVLFLIGLFIPNNTIGLLVMVISGIAAGVIIFLEYKGIRDAKSITPVAPTNESFKTPPTTPPFDTPPSSL
jgi:hypothetical protein